MNTRRAAERKGGLENTPPEAAHKHSGKQGPPLVDTPRTEGVEVRTDTVDASKRPSANDQVELFDSDSLFPNEWGEKTLRSSKEERPCLRPRGEVIPREVLAARIAARVAAAEKLIKELSSPQPRDDTRPVDEDGEIWTELYPGVEIPVRLEGQLVRIPKRDLASLLSHYKSLVEVEEEFSTLLDQGRYDEYRERVKEYVHAHGVGQHVLKTATLDRLHVQSYLDRLRDTHDRFQYFSGKQGFASELQGFLAGLGAYLKCPSEGCGKPAVLRARQAGTSPDGVFQFAHSPSTGYHKRTHHGGTVQLPKLKLYQGNG